MITFINFTPWPLLIGLSILILTGIRCRGRGWLYLLGLALFGMYLLVAIAELFFPITLPENWPANLTWEATLADLRGINLIPFYYGSMFTGSASMHPASPRTILLEIGGNLLLTVPFGFFMCFLTSIRGKRLLLLALWTGLALEGTQLLLKLGLGLYVHAVDINDVILNGLGVLVGAGAYGVARWAWRTVARWVSGQKRSSEA